MSIAEQMAKHWLDLDTGGSIRFRTPEDPGTIHVLNDKGNWGKHQAMLEEVASRYPNHTFTTKGEWSYDGGGSWYDIEIVSTKKVTQG